MDGRRKKEKTGIITTTGKIRKILITGGVWTTERSREVAGVYGLDEKSGNARRAEQWRLRRGCGCGRQELCIQE